MPLRRLVRPVYVQTFLPSTPLPQWVQWTKVPPGASGSVITIATSFVPGGSLAPTRGATSAPSQVKRVGMRAPSFQGPFTTSFRPALGSGLSSFLSPQPVTRKSAVAPATSH